MNENKIYVDVNATFTKDGMLLPKSFVWEDGMRSAKRKTSGGHPAYRQAVPGCDIHVS